MWVVGTPQRLIYNTQSSNTKGSWMCSHCFTVTKDISRKLCNLIGMGLGFGTLKGFWWICFFRCQFFRIVSWDWAIVSACDIRIIGFHSLRNQGIPKLPQQPEPHRWPQKDLFKMGVTEEKTFCLQSFWRLWPSLDLYITRKIRKKKGELFF